MHFLHRTTFIFLVTLVSWAFGLRIELSSADRLELRNVDLPDGSEVTLYVIHGNPAVISFGNQKIIGETVEFDLTNQILRIIGDGTYYSGTETVQGNDLELVIDDELFSIADVVIVTSAIDVYGDSASKVPGQISIIAGRFSPCSRCSQIVEDYGFKADRLELFPGDRLVAYEVTVLIRGEPFFDLPLMVLPLAGAEFSPQFDLIAGSSTEKARVTVQWPYVSSSNAFGKFSINYFADVNPTNSNFLARMLLGGEITQSYLGGSLRHRFFTEKGHGEAELEYTPSFIVPEIVGGKTADFFKTRFFYSLDPEPQNTGPTDFLLERNDATRNRIVQYLLRASGSHDLLEATFKTQGFLDLSPKDSIEGPNYDDLAIPRKTIAEFGISSSQIAALRLGSLSLEDLHLAIGIFEDSPHPTNRDVASSDHVTAARILEGHTLTLDALSPWKGMELAGTTKFAGRYYDSGERLIDWDTNVKGSQAFGQIGLFSVSFYRDINEGQTPFLFDQNYPKTETSVYFNLDLVPLNWLAVTINGGYGFQNSRSPRTVGFQPMITTLNFLQNSSWITGSLSHQTDLKGDPGTLLVQGAVNTFNNGLKTNLVVTHIQDLKGEFHPNENTQFSDTETQLNAEFGFGDWFVVGATGGYAYSPPHIDNSNDSLEFWNDLELHLEVGTVNEKDQIPGLGLTYARDLNTGSFSSFDYEFSVSLGPISLRASEQFGRQGNTLPIGSYNLGWRDITSLSASGFHLLQPSWLGLAREEGNTETWEIELLDTPRNGHPSWQVSFRTQSAILETATDSRMNGTRGLQNSEIQTHLRVSNEYIGPFQFGVTAFAELMLKDHSRRHIFLRSANINLHSQLLNLVGLQGKLGFLGEFDQVNAIYTRSRLTISDFAVTVNPIKGLYFGTMIDDVWDFSGTTHGQYPWNFQPKLFVALDRCCWGFYAHWDSQSGQIKLAIGGPGNGKVFMQEFDTPLFLQTRQGRL